MKTKKPLIEKKEKLSDNIEEYFSAVEGKKEAIVSRELFTGNKDIDLKTDLFKTEITKINALLFNDYFLESKGLNGIFGKYIEQHMRLKFSIDRKSRGEFVTINSEKSDIDKASSIASNLSNITNAKK